MNTMELTNLIDKVDMLAKINLGGAAIIIVIVLGVAFYHIKVLKDFISFWKPSEVKKRGRSNCCSSSKKEG
jgi:hypothetical protein